MKSVFTGLLLAIVVCQAYAQKEPIKFGDVPLEDLKMKVYARDTTAAAVVLADFGESTMKYDQGKGDFVLVFERIKRIKILTTDGLSYANQEIYLYGDGGRDETVSGLKVITYNLENGKVVETKAKSENLLKEKFSDNWDVIKIAPIAVRQGSVIDVTYRVTSEFLVHLQDWEFQSTIPVRLSEYRTNVPEWFTYDKYMQGYLQLAVNESKMAPNSISITTKERSGSMISQTEFSTDKIDFLEARSRWVVKDAPAFRSEPFITTYKDYLSKINFELAYVKYPNSAGQAMLGSWDKVNERFQESSEFGGEVKSNGFLKKIAEEATATADTPEKKIAAVHQHLVRRMAWNGDNHLLGGALKKAYDDSRGSAAQINLMMTSMLEKIGIEAYPVLVSTRDHGFIRKATPASSQFNYVICAAKVGDKFMLLDATDKFLPAGVLPERCLNGEGLIVSKFGPRWVALTAPLKSKKMMTATLTLNPDGTLKGSVRLDQTGYYAQAGRKSFHEIGEKEYVKKFKGQQTWEIEKSSFQNFDQVYDVCKEEHNVLITDPAAANPDVVYLDMMLGLREPENPFKSETRDYPVDFGSPLEKMYVARFVVPDGFVVDELPKTKIVLLPENAARYTFNASQMGNTINVTSHLQINKSLFTQEEYVHLREFYSQVVAKQAEQIVLKKK